MGIREANAARVLNTGGSFKDRAKNALIDSILSNFDNNPSCFEVERVSDNSFFNALITDNSSGANGEKVDDTKSIVLKPGEILSVGDIFEWMDNKWICVKSEPFNGDLYYKGTIQKCNNSLKFYYPPPPNENSILKEVPCVVSNKVSLGSSENRFMTLPDGNIMVIAPNNSDTLNIYHGQRFVLGRSIYKVDNLDDISNVGILNIKMSQTQKNVSDDLVTGIATDTTSTPSSETLF